MKNTLKALLAVAAIALVAACGGGGNGGGKPNGPSATLRTQPPVTDIGIPAGASGSADIEVRGGKPPYGVTSSTGAVGAYLSMDNILFLTGYGNGSGELLIYDESLPVQTVKIKVTSKVSAIASDIGDSMTLAPNESRKFNVWGGLSPYTVSSDNAGVARASISGSTVTVTAQPVAADAEAAITVKDSTLGQTLKITAKVKTKAMSIVPAGDISGAENTSQTLIVKGGVAPYGTTISGSAGVATALVSDSLVTVNLAAAGTATLSIYDSTGQSVVVKLTVTAVEANAFKILPTNWTVNEGYLYPIEYVITGGSAPYYALVSTAHQSLVEVQVKADAATTGADTGASGTTTASGAKGGGKLRVLPRTNTAGHSTLCVDEDTIIPIDVYDANLQTRRVTLTIRNGVTACPVGEPTDPLTPK